ncbi:LINE-1 retrotransposable element ORF2 protein [Camelus dromedarius]|uniref:LINE-1 retrotransposable element ORF2 protein n=1 Tax=Camelus dromedarius TaxID=9838 RepID=A0A5N4DEU0_CAMDR|nr:LINE-1 retrotransposable element ORF2 protein [Camelus dromedarius]
MTNAGEAVVWKSEPSYTAGGNVVCMAIPQKTRNRLSYDPGILLLGIYPEGTLLQNDTCTLMFTAALFTIAKTWKQLKCPSTDDWIKKMCYIYTMEYYSAIKTDSIMPFAAT